MGLLFLTSQTRWQKVSKFLNFSDFLAFDLHKTCSQQCILFQGCNPRQNGMLVLSPLPSGNDHHGTYIRRRNFAFEMNPLLFFEREVIKADKTSKLVLGRYKLDLLRIPNIVSQPRNYNYGSKCNEEKQSVYFF